MRWEMGRRSENVEDRRGMGGGLGRGVQVGGLGGLGLVAVALIAMFLGIDPSVVLNSIPMDDQSSAPASTPRSGPPAGDRQADFVSAVLAQTEDAWQAQFAQMGRRYQDPQLVLFDGQVNSACGLAGSATGPFYCPGDQKLYLDMSFFDELDRRFGAPGDFARAYVIAHEVGHHVQTLLGVTGEVDRLRRQLGRSEANQLSVMTELQADCFAGVWARQANQSQHILEPGDIEAGLRAASAVGDDRIQKATQGYVVPDAFTHGSSAQRMRWFKTGLDSGTIEACDTFNAPQL